MKLKEFGPRRGVSLVPLHPPLTILPHVFGIYRPFPYTGVDPGLSVGGFPAVQAGHKHAVSIECFQKKPNKSMKLRKFQSPPDPRFFQVKNPCSAKS